MPSDGPSGASVEKGGKGDSNLREPEYQATFLDTPLWFVSLVRRVRERLRERKISVPASHSEARLPVTEMQPWYRDFPNQLKSLFERPPAPVIRRASRPAAVPEIWQDFKPQPASWMNSLLAHVLAVSALVLPFALGRMLEPTKGSDKIEPVRIYLPKLPPSWTKSGGGGGGGDRSPTPASLGAIPSFAREQLAPPIIRLLDLMPKMPVQPTLLGPPELELPQMDMKLPWGDPQGALGPLSGGPGCCAGAGTGEGPGMGPDGGAGFGPGKKWGHGGGEPIYPVGGNVSAPIPIYKPEPAYSEQARKAKYQGLMTLWIVVDAQGKVADVRVVKPLGMGLDEQAVNTVRTWKFIPAKRNSVPVAVRILVEITFRLF